MSEGSEMHYSNIIDEPSDEEPDNEADEVFKDFEEKIDSDEDEEKIKKRKDHLDFVNFLQDFD